MMLSRRLGRLPVQSVLESGRRRVGKAEAFPLLLVAVLGAQGCSTVSNTKSIQQGSQTQAAAVTGTAVEGDKKDEAKDKKSKERERRLKRNKLQRELVVANEKLRKAKTASDAQAAEDRAAAEKTLASKQLADKKLADFQEQQAPLRLSRGQLDLARAEDYAKESEEELVQLEMMYKEEDLADKTREIVLNRGRRRLERAKTGLAIQVRDLKHLQQQTLVLEAEELRVTALDKSNEAAKTQRDTQSNLLDKQIEVLSAEMEITRIEEDLAALEEEAAEDKP